MREQVMITNKEYQENHPFDILGPHGGDRQAAEARWGIKADQFLDFSASINPLGPSPFALQAVRENLQQLANYPQPLALALKKALAEYLQIDQLNIILGNGSLELIYLCGRMFGSKRVIVLAPGFSEYGQGINNPEIIRVKMNLVQPCLPLEELADILEAKDLIFIANPNNPTGNLFSREEMLQLSVLVKGRQAVLAADEAFIDFVGETNASLRDMADQDHLIVLGSMTKFFALPGLRIGYALSSRKNIQNMERLLPRWRINSLALAAGTAALQDDAYIKKTLQLVAEERAFLSSELIKLGGFAVMPSQTNFILVDASQRRITAGQLQAKLGPEGILIRDCSNFEHLSPDYFRLAIRDHTENLRLLQTLRKVLV